MKAVVLAAGRGERLRPLTNKLPKPMLEVAGRPLLENTLERLSQAGVREIHMNLHHCPEIIRNYFQDGQKWGVSIDYTLEEELNGTAGTVKNFQESLIKDQSFLVCYGDNFFDYDFSQFVEAHHRHQAIGTVLLVEAEEVSQSGIVEVDDHGRILRFAEKPKTEREIFSRLINAGLYAFKPEIFNFIPEKTPSDFARDIFPRLMREGIPLYGVALPGRLGYFDTPALYNKFMEKLGEIEKCKS